MAEKAVMTAHVSLEVGDELIFTPSASSCTTEDRAWGAFCDARRGQRVKILEIRLYKGYANGVKVQFLPDSYEKKDWSGLHNFTVPERVPAVA